MTGQQYAILAYTVAMGLILGYAALLWASVFANERTNGKRA
jgi:hypothetical protein